MAPAGVEIAAAFDQRRIGTVEDAGIIAADDRLVIGLFVIEEEVAKVGIRVRVGVRDKPRRAASGRVAHVPVFIEQPPESTGMFSGVVL